MSKTFEP